MLTIYLKIQGLKNILPYEKNSENFYIINIDEGVNFNQLIKLVNIDYHQKGLMYTLNGKSNFPKEQIIKNNDKIIIYKLYPGG